MELTPTLILNLVLLIVPPVTLVLVFRQWLARHIRCTRFKINVGVSSIASPPRFC